MLDEMTTTVDLQSFCCLFPKIKNLGHWLYFVGPVLYLAICSISDFNMYFHSFCYILSLIKQYVKPKIIVNNICICVLSCHFKMYMNILSTLVYIDLWQNLVCNQIGPLYLYPISGEYISICIWCWKNTQISTKSIWIWDPSVGMSMRKYPYNLHH
jgi:hypothetical protein